MWYEDSPLIASSCPLDFSYMDIPYQYSLKDMNLER